MSNYINIKIPSQGQKIEVGDSALKVPDEVIIPFIEGDGVGPDIWRATRPVTEAAVEKAYQGRRKIHWMEIYAGQKAKNLYDHWLPDETLEAIREFTVAIKGPLTTPIATGYRSLNVTMRQQLDLYACVRPITYIEGVPSPIKNPQDVDFVIFRENTEDLYAGIEWPEGSPENRKLFTFLHEEMGQSIRPDSGLGIKPISIYGSKRLVRKALRYAIDAQKPSLTLVHKGNIMKYTEGAFRDWGYQVAKEEFGPYIVTEDEVKKVHGGQRPQGKVVIKDRLTDSMFQQILTRPGEYSVIATTNVNGDYLSDAALALVGGLGMGPGANMGDALALFEPVHGSAPQYAGKDMVNPSALILSASLMLEYMGWKDASEIIKRALKTTILQKTLTYDLERQTQGARLLKTSQFGMAVIEAIEK